MTTVSAASLFALRGDLRLKSLKTCLGTDFRVRKEGTSPCERILLDSFDWRLYRAGAALEYRTDLDSSSLVWETLAGAEIADVTPAGEAPRWAADLPVGPLRDRIGPLLGPRALLPQVKLRGHTRRLRVLTAAGEPVARLEVREEHPHGKHRLPGLLRVLAEPGREALADAVLSHLRDAFPLVPLNSGPVIAALEAAGVRPGGYDPNVHVPLEPGMPAEHATRAILRSLLGTLQANVPGLCGHLDCEFLHDFRIAVRRTRAALAQLRRALPARSVAHYREEFTWLGQLTSTARDMDVYLLAFDSYRQALPAELQAPFEPLRDLLLKIQTREYTALREALQGPRYRRLVRRYSRFLSREAGARTAGKEALRPIAKLARERVWSLYLEALGEGSSIHPDSHPDELHELRKTCKKLRYLMEFFIPLFPRAEIQALIGELKRFQDNLGEIQDLRVQQESLGIFAHQLKERGTADPPTFEAIDWLVAHQRERQRDARAAFAVRFERFASEENRVRFHSLFGRNGPAVSNN